MDADIGGAGRATGHGKQLFTLSLPGGDTRTTIPLKREGVAEDDDDGGEFTSTDDSSTSYGDPRTTDDETDGDGTQFEDAGEQQPIRVPVISIPPAFEAEVEEEIKGMVDAGIIRLTESLWAFGTVVTAKRNEERA